MSCIFSNPLLSPYLSKTINFAMMNPTSPGYTDSSGTEIFRIGVMVKERSGYDPENDDWWYAVYNPDGTNPSMTGKIAFCITCHKQAGETDYLFSKEVLEAFHE